MSPRNVLESQQSVHAELAGRTAAGCWKLASRQALSLRPQEHSVLEIAQGRAWVTLSGTAAHGVPMTPVDHMLQPGDRLAVLAGQHLVMEAWSHPHSDGAVAFRWDAAPVPAGAPAASRAECDWECGVVLPLRDLLRALGQGGRAAVGVVGAAGRFVAGLSRFALHRMAGPLQRRPA